MVLTGKHGFAFGLTSEISGVASHSLAFFLTVTSDYLLDLTGGTSSRMTGLLTSVFLTVQ
jgi:hypothetical protein